MLYTWVLRWDLLKPMQILTHPNTRLLKPIRCTTKYKQKPNQSIQKLLKPMRLCTKDHRQEDRNTWILAPGRPSDKDNVLHAPAQLRLARSHARHETKTKTKRSRSPGYGGRTSRTNSPKPPINTAKSPKSPPNLDFCHIWPYSQIRRMENAPMHISRC